MIRSIMLHFRQTLQVKTLYVNRRDLNHGTFILWRNGGGFGLVTVARVEEELRLLSEVFVDGAHQIRVSSTAEFHWDDCIPVSQAVGDALLAVY